VYAEARLLPENNASLPALPNLLNTDAPAREALPAGSREAINRARAAWSRCMCKGMSSTPTLSSGGSTGAAVLAPPPIRRPEEEEVMGRAAALRAPVLEEAGLSSTNGPGPESFAVQEMPELDTPAVAGRGGVCAGEEAAKDA